MRQLTVEFDIATNREDIVPVGAQDEDTAYEGERVALVDAKGARIEGNLMLSKSKLWFAKLDWSTR